MSDISSRCAAGDHDACWSVLWIPALEHMPPCACACHSPKPCVPVTCTPLIDVETHHRRPTMNHFTANGVHQDDDGFYRATCSCGFKVIAVDDESLVHILMDHAYEAGRAEAAS